MVTWRDLGLEKGSIADEFTPVKIECPFCGNKGHYNRVYRGEVLDNNESTVLYADVWQCIACANFTFAYWRTEEGYCAYRVYPYKKQKSAAHISWPSSVQHAYLAAINALLTEDWQMSMMMARHAIGEATKSFEAKGEGLLQEIDNLRQRQLITTTLTKWAHKMPQLLTEIEASPEKLALNAKELLRFCRYFLDILFTLAHDANAYHHH